MWCFDRITDVLQFRWGNRNSMRPQIAALFLQCGPIAYLPRTLNWRVFAMYARLFTDNLLIATLRKVLVGGLANYQTDLREPPVQVHMATTVLDQQSMVISAIPNRRDLVTWEGAERVETDVLGPQLRSA